MNYQKKAVPVRAVQFRKDEPWPPGVYKHAWNVGPGDNDEVLPTVDVGPRDERRKMWLRDGEWIVTYPSGVVERCSEAVFQAVFEEVPTVGTEAGPDRWKIL
jgi:hypothetical protein